ncbi:hypothetical protein [Neisseria animalis]|uniref:Periplasmic protein n=1 Tax=Neisseria animalis TaxID=492 RepID=A0A5P3MQL9_NEIAN|nr:hypothetical protein [Neisseria animalis]QEY23874.1 hypothetical protein D0T90_04615 [Neisseria animalis]ROW32059.1 hypothetical protein CGZ60_06920 [Neisseria animalis]VEE05761.1 Periplasmic protein [Neisseria animalis]
MKTKTATLLKITAALIVLFAVFRAGMAFQGYLYEDTCLDLGGGRNPGNFPICVIDDQTRQERYGQP